MSGAASLVLVDALVWAAWSAVVGVGVHLVPDRWFARDTWVTRSRGWERGGRTYAERLRIRRWKDRVPDAGAWFDRDGSKRRVGGHSPAAVDRYLRETRRAEYVHGGILLATPAFALWNPWPLLLAMVGYGLLANLPCIAIQRYNRIRLERIAARRPATAGCSA